MADDNKNVDVEQLKESVDIVDVIGKYIEIDESGKALCPFHEESTPSFTTSQEDQFYYCFGCGVHGDVIDFVKDYKKVSFKKACEEISGGKFTKYSPEEKTRLIRKAPKPPPMTKEEVLSFIADHSYESGDYRGIDDKYSKFFGHLVSKDSDGKVTASYYPETKDGVVTGYKCRNHPKDFRYGKVGATGGSSDLSGQVKFKSGGKYLLIVGGEADKVAAYEMLVKSQQERGQGEFSAPAVVSPTTGEVSAHKQIAAQYDFCNQFDIIVLGFDNDEAGIKAAEATAKVLPQEKVRVARWTKKDPNMMLNLKMGKQFIRDFYSAREYIATKIQTSHNLLKVAKAELCVPRISLPPYMNKLQRMMGGNGGGVRQGVIVNIIGDTSVGKSTHINGLFYHLIQNSPEKPAILSLEATAGQYTLDMISIHLEMNLTKMDEALALEKLEDPKVEKLVDELLVNDLGEERFLILDERDGDISLLEKQMEQMSHQYGCKVFVIDVLTDILRGSSAEKQEDHMVWQKGFVKEGNTIFNILHTRKPPIDKEGKTRPINEYDAFGSSSFVQSAAINILIDRDKMSTDPTIQSTTRVRMPKCRGGITGNAGEWFYDINSRKVYDKDHYFGEDG